MAAKTAFKCAKFTTHATSLMHCYAQAVCQGYDTGKILGALLCINDVRRPILQQTMCDYCSWIVDWWVGWPLLQVLLIHKQLL